MPDITELHAQREIKPKIEDVLPHLLEGSALTEASNFSAYLKENKVNLKWAGIHNAWKADYKGKPLLYLRLNCKPWNRETNAK